MILNPESFESSTLLKTEALKKSIFSAYKSIQTETDEDLSYEKEILKKFSSQITPKNSKRIKTTFQSNEYSSFAKDKSKISKKGSLKLKSLIFRKDMEKSNVQESPRREKNNISSLISDPFLNGRIKREREQFISSLSTSDQDIKNLYHKIEELEFSFLRSCASKDYSKAEKVLVKIINFAIDMNEIGLLTKSIKLIAEFHYVCNKLEQAFYYFNQTRKCAYLTGNNLIVIQALIKQAICANKVHLYDCSIVFLKKALQYAWFFGQKTLELMIYDELGKVYFLIGDSEKAKKYHCKYFEANTEDKKSAILLLSKQSLILEGLNERKIYTDISSVFLWNLRIPIEKISDLPQFPSNNRRQKSVRKQIEEDISQLKQFKQIKRSIIDNLKDPFFQNSISEPYFDDDGDWTIPSRSYKYISVDIQRNKHLLKQGINFEKYFNPQEKIKVKIIRNDSKDGKNGKKNQDRQGKQMERQKKKSEMRLTVKLDLWYKNLAGQSIRNTRNNGRGLLNRVQLRGIDKLNEPNLRNLRIIFHQLFAFQTHQ